MTDHIDAIAIGIESLGFNIGASFERRAKASFIEQALKLSGFQITPAPECPDSDSFYEAKMPGPVCDTTDGTPVVYPAAIVAEQETK